MSKWLASVSSLEEATQLESMFPDILDMKDPAKGALGALTVAEVSEIVDFVNGRCLTSATIGDLPMNVETIRPSIIQMATSGVDYVKIGLFPDANLETCINDLSTTLHTLKTPVIAVLFADLALDQDYLAQLKASGFYGVMIDTAQKNGQHVLAHWDLLELKRFVNDVHSLGMVCGLAGALRYEDIKVLKPLQADYLGFRSALCQQRLRTSLLDSARIESIHQAMQSS